MTYYTSKLYLFETWQDLLSQNRQRLHHNVFGSAWETFATFASIQRSNPTKNFFFVDAGFDQVIQAKAPLPLSLRLHQSKNLVYACVIVRVMCVYQMQHTILNEHETYQRFRLHGNPRDKFFDARSHTTGCVTLFMSYPFPPQ